MAANTLISILQKWSPDQNMENRFQKKKKKNGIFNEIWFKVGEQE